MIRFLPLAIFFYGCIGIAIPGFAQDSTRVSVNNQPSGGQITKSAFSRSETYLHPKFGDPFFNAPRFQNNQIGWIYVNSTRTPSVRKLNGGPLDYIGYNENGSYLVGENDGKVYLYNEYGVLAPVDDTVARLIIKGDQGATGLLNNSRVAHTDGQGSGSNTAAASTSSGTAETTHPASPIGVATGKKIVTILSIAPTADSGTLLTFMEASGNKDSLRIQRPAALDGQPVSAPGPWVSVSADKKFIRFIIVAGKQALINDPVPVNAQTQKMMPKGE